MCARYYSPRKYRSAIRPGVCLTLSPARLSKLPKDERLARAPCQHGWKREQRVCAAFKYLSFLPIHQGNLHHMAIPGVGLASHFQSFLDARVRGVVPDVGIRRAMRAWIGSEQNGLHLMEVFVGLFLRQFDFDTDVASWSAENAVRDMAGIALHLRHRIASGADRPLADPGTAFIFQMETHGIDSVNVVQAADGRRRGLVAGQIIGSEASACQPEPGRIMSKKLLIANSSGMSPTIHHLAHGALAQAVRMHAWARIASRQVNNLIEAQGIHLADPGEQERVAVRRFDAALIVSRPAWLLRLCYRWVFWHRTFLPYRLRREKAAGWIGLG